MEDYKFGESVGSAQERHAPASPPAAAQTALSTAAYANGAVRSHSPPARWTTAAWAGVREKDHLQGSGEYGGWWGGAQGRGKWGDEQAACNQAPPPPPTPTSFENWTPPPLRTGWGIECGVRHAEHPLWEPYAVEWHRRGRNGETQLTWRQFVRWMEDTEPEDTTAVVRPAAQHPPPPPVASSPPLPATYSLVPTTTRITAYVAAPAAAAAPVPLAGQLYSQVAAVAALRSPDLGTMSDRSESFGTMSERYRSKTVSDRHCSDIGAVSEQLSEQLRKTTSAPKSSKVIVIKLVSQCKSFVG